MQRHILGPEKLIYKLRDLKEAFPRLGLLEKCAPDYVSELYKVQNTAREFGTKYVEPIAEKLDKKIEEDHNYFHWDIVYKALPYRFLSYLIPKQSGGKGLYATHFSIFMEELCSFCPGIANIFGAHALGISPIVLLPDTRHFATYLKEVADKERKGEPVLFALAITEPEAGSDVEDADFLKAAKLVTHARRVNGGYVLQGRKVFISNGNVARYIWVGTFLDRRSPLQTGVSFIVKNDAKGFSVGRIERKMGQRACPAAELIFEDVFIPEEDVVGDVGEGERLTALVLGSSRAPVAAIATGIARGAFERLLKYLNDTTIKGRYLFEEQWCQIMLVDILAKIQMARQLYLDAAICCDLLSTSKLMEHPLMKAFNLVPGSIINSDLAQRIFNPQKTYEFVRRLAKRSISDEALSLVAGYSSLAKFSASDLAIEVTSTAMQIMQEDGAISSYGIEKLYRDAKLTQIYEGTNQINRLYAFKNILVERK